MAAGSPYPFTAHNIALPDGSQTHPERGSLIEDEGIVQAPLRTLRMLFPPEVRAETTVVDLGCLEGGYTVAFARAGFQALGIEARESNFANCQFVAEKLGLANLCFVQDDVRNIGEYGPFDVVFCSGLLYHMDTPSAYLEQLAANARKALIINTHYITGFPVEIPGLRFSGTEPVTHEGNLGIWFNEYPANAAPAAIEANRWAAWGNPGSFWMHKDYLLQRLRDVGFGIIYEQYDFLDNVITDKFIKEYSRSLFVAIKETPGD